MARGNLILLTRFPEPGRVKTRLIPALGKEGAADLHRRLTETTLKTAEAAARRYNLAVEIRYDGGTEARIRSWLGSHAALIPQCSGNLGDRMAEALQESRKRGYRKTVLIGSDCPQLTVFHIGRAFQLLDRNRLVLGPALDGGYYLIGQKEISPALFQGMTWGSSNVYASTLHKAKREGMTVGELDPLSDVDRPLDLPIWESTKRLALSIVIPARNEEDNLPSTLERIGRPDNMEVIVVDGDSSDRTRQIALDWGARVISTSPGRGGQMNLGAIDAQGDILLFLHADTRLPHNAISRIRAVLSDPEILGGYFRLKFFPSSQYLRFKEKKIFFRTKWFRLPFGDQAFFVRSAVFRASGGYLDIPLMEDVEFILRLRRMGKLTFLDETVETSSRRFQNHGAIQATLKNKLVFYGYFLGIPPKRLARWYYKGTPQNSNKELND